MLLNFLCLFLFLLFFFLNFFLFELVKGFEFGSLVSNIVAISLDVCEFEVILGAGGGDEELFLVGQLVCWAGSLGEPGLESTARLSGLN